MLRSDSASSRPDPAVAPIAPGNLQVHWPEGNVLIDATGARPQAGIPDYNALVTVRRAVADRLTGEGRTTRIRVGETVRRHGARPAG